jgi:hypothetical protein
VRRPPAEFGPIHRRNSGIIGYSHSGIFDAADECYWSLFGDIDIAVQLSAEQV